MFQVEVSKAPNVLQLIQDAAKGDQRAKVNMQKLLNTFPLFTVIKVICKYIFLAKFNIFEITIIKNN